jgi:uracil-DNA glycosylase family 4
VAHCAPPDNKPTRDEIAACSEWLAATFDVVPFRVIVALGGIAWSEVIREAKRRAWLAERLPKFGHGAAARLTGDRHLLGSYHPSQQNTFTGRLTESMLDDVFVTARGWME